MKVFLPAIDGLVPPAMVRAVRAFLEFCYLVRRSQIDEDVLLKIDAAVRDFHQERESFREHGIREDFLLPRQHSIIHYRQLIQMFGAPNGLCSSITESKHIKAVKEPYRRSNRNQPLGQMLRGNPIRSSMAYPQLQDPSQETMTDADPDQEAVGGLTLEGDVRLPKRASK